MSTLEAPVDHLDVRRHNLSLVVRLLAQHGPRSRAGVASVTGLTRATVSSLVGELIERGLAREVGPETDQRIGRPATLVELDGSRVVTVGVGLDIGFVAVLGRDLAGNEVYRRQRPLAGRSTAFSEVLPLLVAELRSAIEHIQRGGAQVAGITLAVPGIVDMSTGIVERAPNLGWVHEPLVPRLRATLASVPEIAADNEGNLGALAEYRVGPLAGTNHLAYVLALNGVGAGFVIDGRVFRGASGAAGEVGHTVVQRNGEPCACGSRGCWETTIGLRALVRSTVPDLADALLADHHLSPYQKAEVVVERARARDAVALRGLRTYGRWLGIGLANLIDTFNPSAVVLAGYIPALAEWVLPLAQEEIAASALSEATAACRVELSTLGDGAGALGGAIHAAEHVFADPTLIG